MPTLTGQIIKDIVSKEVTSATSILQSEISGVRNEVKNLDQKVNGLDQKIDTVITQLSDIAGQFKKFDEEQTVLSGQMSNRTDRIVKLEVSVFGDAAA